MSTYFFRQLTVGNEMPPYKGVECSVRVFPWTEEFVKDGKVVHYFEYDEMTNEDFFQERFKVWTSFFEAIETNTGTVAPEV